MKQYDKAIEFLSKFNSDDKMLAPVALGAIGDAFADINQLEDALDYYEKAANKKNNEFTTPLFLFKAGQTAMSLKNYSKATKLFTTIKESYPKSEQGRDIEKFINAAKYASN
jgi:tetratricopeptide (TPR) repeat protein